MNFDHLSSQERLAAEQAILVYRAIRQSAQAAPHGSGLAHAEAAALSQGKELLRTMLSGVLNERPEAQKKGFASVNVRAAVRRSLKRARKERC